MFRSAHPFLLILLMVLCVSAVSAQNANLSGLVQDPQSRVIAGATIIVTGAETGLKRTLTTNGEGLYFVPSLQPGRYLVVVQMQGFQTASRNNVTLEVAQNARLDFILQVGAVEQTVNVEGIPLVDTQDASVSTVVDRKFVENVPLNGRSFQSLFLLTPGLVFTSATAAENGQFSVNGQRADSNYLSIDGAAANVGAVPNFLPGQALAGSVPGLSASGGTNNLVSIDALQEFRVQTSSFAPEYGRTPGAQVSVTTRSGTNSFHGALYEYFRNDILDANDWFSNQNNSPKKALRQNDLGGVVGGPILRNRTFFFFSYEGLRLRQPQFVSSSVPSLAARQNAPTALQPFLNAFPKPNGPDRIGANGLPTGFAPFNAGFSVPSSFDATSLRLDHTIGGKLALFARYNYAPSNIIQRGSSSSLNTQNPISFKTQTGTVGATLGLTTRMSNEFRFNYSRTSTGQRFFQDDFGGATVPPSLVLFATFPQVRGPELSFSLSSGVVLIAGKAVDSLQRQVNIVDTFSATIGSHQGKFGIDYRRLTPVVDPRPYLQGISFTSMGITAPGVPPPAGSVFSGRPASASILVSTAPLFPAFTNFSVFVQDTWRIKQRLVFTYGVRWDVNPAPRERNGNLPFTVTGINNPTTATLAPAGTPPYSTTYANLAPRFGIAYQLFQGRGRETVLRGGFGVFYDLGNQQAANGYLQGFPFSATKIVPGATFPLTPSQAAPPSLDPSRPVTSMTIFGPEFQLPRTYQWNIAFEQAIGDAQTVTLSYVAAAGRKLVRQDTYSGTAFGGALNPAVFGSSARVNVLRNSANSDYHSLQIRYQRKLSHRLQALASYTWSHSIDTQSNDSDALNLISSSIDLNAERGSSDFDVRHSFSGAVSYDVPSPSRNRFAAAVFGHWSVQALGFARTAFPVNVTYTAVTPLGLATLRPDLVFGVPLFLSDPTAAGGKRINPAAFARPQPVRQGNLGRNSLQGFAAWQLDLGLHRQFPLSERLQLQLRSEFFNVLNHPNFGDPPANLVLIPLGLFGGSIRTLAQSLGLGGAGAGFNPLYQVGGPRSIQLSLKLIF